MTWGRTGASFGPAHTSRLPLAVGDNQRRASFPFSALDKYAGVRASGALVGGPAAEIPEPFWVLSVHIRPILSQSASAGLGLVERFRLRRDSGWVSSLEDARSVQVPLDWSQLGR